MPRYRIITLVDITRTGATTSSGSAFSLKQQSNFNSLRQAIELRANVAWHRDPKKELGQPAIDIQGKVTHWSWDIDIEREDVFQLDNDPIGLLIHDLHGVPIIADLENTVELVPAAFQAFGPTINIWISIC